MTIWERAVVGDVRREFEERRVPASILTRLYSPCFPQVWNAREFIEKATRSFPTLNCGVASVYLKYRLGRGVIVHGKYGTCGHTFLRMDDEIVDITADQFFFPGQPRAPRVYIGPLVLPWSA